MRIRHSRPEEKIELQMTPMIDIVFQLLIFFIMTFKIVLPEGDFSIRMPSASAAAAQSPDLLPTIRVRMKANDAGELTSILVNDIDLGVDFAGLRAKIRSLVEDDAGPSQEASEQEVELDCDYNLKYDYTMKAITSISGYYANGREYKLVEKIKFTPVKKQ